MNRPFAQTSRTPSSTVSANSFVVQSPMQNARLNPSSFCMTRKNRVRGFAGVPITMPHIRSSSLSNQSPKSLHRWQHARRAKVVACFAKTKILALRNGSSVVPTKLSVCYADDLGAAHVAEPLLHHSFMLLELFARGFSCGAHNGSCSSHYCTGRIPVPDCSETNLDRRGILSRHVELARMCELSATELAYVKLRVISKSTANAVTTTRPSRACGSTHCSAMRRPLTRLCGKSGLSQLFAHSFCLAVSAFNQALNSLLVKTATQYASLCKSKSKSVFNSSFSCSVRLRIVRKRKRAVISLASFASLLASVGHSLRKIFLSVSCFLARARSWPAASYQMPAQYRR